MNETGRKLLKIAVSEVNPDLYIEVFPRVEGRDTARYVTIETPDDIKPEQVLNALNVARMLNGRGESQGNINLPVLEVLFGSQGSITFEDLNWD